MQYSIVRASVPIFGLARGKNFKEYRVEYGEGKDPANWITIAQSSAPQMKEVTPADLDDSADTTIQGNLANWDTGLKNYVYLPMYPKDHPIDLKGVYTVRLVVTGKDGSTAEDRVTVEVGDVIPNAWGGVAKSRDGSVSLTVPEQAIMDSFRLISIKPVDNASISLPPGRRLIGQIHEFREGGEKFTKDAILEMNVPEKEVGEANLSQVGIFAYDSRKKEWNHLESRQRDGSKALFAKIRELAPYYALAASPIPGEAAVLEPNYTNKKSVTTASLSGPYTHYLVRDTFEDGVGEWSNRDGEVGATMALDNAATFDGTRCLKITDVNGGGNFAVNVRKTPFDVREFPVVQFDYKIPSEVKTNFLVKVSGRWYEIGFTDNPKVLKNKRVNVADIGKIEGVVADGEWHTARFNLYDMLRTKTGNRVVEEIVMADWDVGGYMKLQFGHNRKGATYFIDKFAIGREPGAGLRIAGDTLLIDDFNQRKATNALGGATLTFTDPAGGTLRAGYGSEDAGGKGHSLELTYDVLKPGSFAGYVSNLQNLDLREYKVLSFHVKGAGEHQDLLVGIRDKSGKEHKVPAGAFLPGKITSDWQKVGIPLSAFPKDLDLGRIDSLSLSFASPVHRSGTVLLDSIELQRDLRSVSVEDFERTDRRNLLGGGDYSFVSGAAAVNAVYAKASPNGVQGISYGGNIGEPNSYEGGLNYAGWATDLRGIDCFRCETLSFRIRGAEGGEKPNIYLDDGNFRWGVDVGKFARLTKEWQEVAIPLSEFAEYGVDLTHLEELQVVFEWEKMSGTVFLDDIRLGPK